MKKILFSLLIIGAVSAMVIGGTMSFFSDTEISAGNTFTAGTIEIGVNGQLHWSETFTWDDIKPGKDFEIEFEVVNEGVNPLKLWKIIKCVETDENGIIEPEQEWYDEFNGGDPKNDIDSAIVYEMYVDGQLAISRHAGITMSQIKDNYIGLVKLDQPFEPGNGDGILYPGESVEVIQRYYMPEGTENWAQSDAMTFVMEIEARQISAPEPLQQMSFMDNKYPGWSATADSRMGILKYDFMSPEFNYDFLGVGLHGEEEYCLIYAKDPWAAPKPLIDSGMTDVDGKISLIGSKNLGDLPSTDDENYMHGAKIWLLPCDDYTGSIGWPPYDDWLFDNWPGLINYKQGDRPNEELNCDYDDENTSGDEGEYTIYLNQLGGDIGDQYGYQHDYTGAASNNVAFTYNSPLAGNRLAGTMSASGLKPYATYQVKVTGVPICSDPVEGNDLANEYVGYKGRWTCVSGVTCVGDANARNRSDAQYLARSYFRGDSSECIVGYLVFDYFTADASGNIEIADIGILSDTSYHVLYCSGPVCGTASPNDFVTYGTNDPAHPGVQFCQASGVNGQIESGRGGCDGLTLDTGIYSLKMSLTEESFHQGSWATVLVGDIDFELE